MVREKKWALKDAFKVRMSRGQYIGCEDIESSSGGHLVLTDTGVIRATTIHLTDEPLQGQRLAASSRGWTACRNPDLKWFWRHTGGAMQWMDP